MKDQNCNIPIYHFATTKLLKQDIEKITSVIHKFWWGNSEKDKAVPLLFWNHITKPVWQGGLRLKEERSFNEALLAKQVWWVVSVPQTLNKVITAKYGKGNVEYRRILWYPSGFGTRGTWTIHSLRFVFRKIMCVES